MTKLYIAGFVILFLIVGTMDYSDQVQYAEYISDARYSQDYLDFVNENGIIPCDTDMDCELKNPDIKE